MDDEFKYKHRAGTAAQWADPQDGPLLRGEIGVLLDDNGVPLGAKIGDGETAFDALPDLGANATSGPSVITPPGSLVTLAGAAAAWPDATVASVMRVTVPATKNYRYGLFYVGTQSGNCQFSVIRLTGTDRLTYERVMDSGLVACPAAGSVRIDLGSTELTAGEYGLCLFFDNTTATTRRSFHLEDAFRKLCAGVVNASGVPASGTLADWGYAQFVALGLEEG